jgi:hypothetical protein
MSEGLKLVQVWVPDRTSEKYLVEIRRQCAIANADPNRSETLTWLEGIQAEFVSSQPDFDWAHFGVDPSAPEESKAPLS